MKSKPRTDQFKCPSCGCENSIAGRPKLNSATQNFFSLRKKSSEINARACQQCGHIVWTGWQASSDDQNCLSDEIKAGG